MDEHGRTYIYAKNIAIDHGESQPVHFKLGQDLHLEDSDGCKQTVRVLDIVGSSALLEYETARA